MGQLTSEQALADFAYLVKQVKKDYNAMNCTVFAFGGRYEKCILLIFLHLNCTWHDTFLQIVKNI